MQIFPEVHFVQTVVARDVVEQSLFITVLHALRVVCLIGIQHPLMVVVMVVQCQF